VAAAGWRYCTFSTTSAGIAFLDQPTFPYTIPASPTAVIDGKGAFTGDTGEEFGPTIPVPANALGPNGQLRISGNWAYNNGAGIKTFRNRFSGNAGTVLFTAVPTTTLQLPFLHNINNTGATNVQRGYPNQAAGVWNAPTGNGFVPAAVDTTQASTIVLSHQRNTATDNAIIDNFMVELLSDGT